VKHIATSRRVNDVNAMGGFLNDDIIVSRHVTLAPERYRYHVGSQIGQLFAGTEWIFITNELACEFLRGNKTITHPGEIEHPVSQRSCIHDHPNPGLAGHPGRGKRRVDKEPVCVEHLGIL
jgi:hypothetical protein